MRAVGSLVSRMVRRSIGPAAMRVFARGWAASGWGARRRLDFDSLRSIRRNRDGDMVWLGDDRLSKLNYFQ